MAERLRLPLLLLILLPVVGCGGPQIEEDDAAEPVVTLVLPKAPPGKPVPGEEAARKAMRASSYAIARIKYERLSSLVTNPLLRSEFLFLAGECALGQKEYYQAYKVYTRLLRQYPNTPRFTTAVERIYLVGRLFALKKAKKPSWLLGIQMTDAEFGVQILERFQKARRRHPLADDALHYIAITQYGLAEWDLAIEAWKKLGRLYPRSEWAQTAEYRIALTTLEMSDGVRYDKSPVRNGLKLLKRYVQKHPTGNHVKEATRKIAEVEAALAGQLLTLARFYLRRNKDYAAIVYLKAVQRSFPSTPAAKQARELQNTIPKTSPPPAPPDPKDLETRDDKQEADRLRLAPVPIDDSW